MIDVQEFGLRFKDRLITIAAESRGVSRLEAVRKYNTDATFHAMVDTITLAACQVLNTMDVVEVEAAYQDEFNTEAARLLGWDH
jgi:hypothetical protein